MRLVATAPIRFKTSRGLVTIHPGQTFIPADADVILKAGLAKPAVPSPSGVIDSLLALPLAAFESEGSPMEISVRWFDTTLWFVPSDRDVEALIKSGVSRGRIWTARELSNLFETYGLSKEHVTQIATAKAIFEGTVTA